MTIIVTHISQLGMVHAADSNLSVPGKGLDTGTKLFEIPRLRSALTVAGQYSVGGTPMDRWIKDFISDDTAKSLAEFVENLRSGIETAALPEEKLGNGYFIHIAGYPVGAGRASCAEFHYVANCEIDQAGNYDAFSLTLRSSQEPLQLAPGIGQIFCNGYPSGRQAYFELLTKMSEYRANIWARSHSNFRPPRVVDEEAAYLKNDMKHIKLLFLYSNDPAPVIGGKIDTYCIRSPRT